MKYRSILKARNGVILLYKHATLQYLSGDQNKRKNRGKQKENFRSDSGSASSFRCLWDYLLHSVVLKSARKEHIQNFERFFCLVGGIIKIFNEVIEDRSVPPEWKKAIKVPIFKNTGSKLDQPHLCPKQCFPVGSVDKD